MQIVRLVALITWSVIVINAQGEDRYFTATGQEDGKPLIFRSMRDVPKGAVESDYPNLISIFWAYKAPNDSGMPDTRTNEQQIVFEDALEPLDRSGSGHLMLVVTGNGRKEWHWYVADTEAWMEGLNKALKEKPVVPIEIEYSDQPDWSLYHGFMKAFQ